MNKVITINLNGRAYQLEERGYDALRKYLETAAAKLGANPDKDEIMADFEQAIADKCDEKMNGHKNVVSEKEIDEIIAAMGPVDASGDKEAGEAAADASKNETGEAKAGSNGVGPKRLFRIPRGEWIMGVCTGLAAYFNLDVTLIRVVFILLTLLTHGFWVLAYIILAVIMPPAKTEEDYAQAHGEWPAPPFNAHDFIEQAKVRYAEFQKMHDEHKSKEEINKWKRNLKKEMRQKKQQMKQEWRAQQREWHQNWHGRKYDTFDHNDAPYNDRPGTDEYNARRYGASYGFSRAIFGFFAVVVSLVLLAASIAWVFALVSLIRYGTVFGYALGAGHPLWVSIVFLAAFFYIITVPFRLMLHNAWGTFRYRSGWGEFGRAIIFFAMLAVLIYTARELFPSVNALWDTSIAWLKLHL